MHNSGLSILLFVIFSLSIGALIKALMHNSRLPYTVVLLLIGIAIGGFNQFGYFGEQTLMTEMFSQAGNIDPHLILKMEHDGVLESAEAQHLIDKIEIQMINVRKQYNKIS